MFRATDLANIAIKELYIDDCSMIAAHFNVTVCYISIRASLRMALPSSAIKFK